MTVFHIFIFYLDSDPPKLPLSVAVSENLTIAVHRNGVLTKSELYSLSAIKKTLIQFSSKTSVQFSSFVFK